MSKKTIKITAIISVIFFSFIYIQNFYNKFIDDEEGIKKIWEQVESQYQRRTDLIPELVSTVKSYTSQKKEDLESLIAARNKAIQCKIDDSKLNAESLTKFQNVQNILSSEISKLMLIVENDPNLKANENFISLKAQLGGTKNRIAYECKQFNESVKAYNNSCRRFPNNIFAKIFRFNSKEYFKLDAGEEKVVKIEF